MSSLNDSSGPAASHNDSIPLDDEEDSVSIYYDEENDGSYSQSEDVSDRGPSSLDYSSVSRTNLSHSISQSRGARAQSEEYTGTASYYTNGEGGSLSYGYDDEDYEYSSGYDSMTYGDSSLRSPQSELSSTFASFYYENEFVVRTRSTLHFLRRPLYYLAFATAGSGVVGSVFRLATTAVRRHLDSVADASLGALPGSGGGVGGAGGSGPPYGYPSVPEWLREVRAALPAAMEVPASWLLRWHNIPVLSDLMGESQQLRSATTLPASSAAAGLATHVSSGVQEAWQSWQTSGPAIPVALFLPLFSVVAIKVAQHVRPSQQSFTALLRAQQDAEDAEVASAYLSTTSPVRPASVNASPIQAAATSPGNTSTQSTVMDAPPTTRGHVSAARQQQQLPQEQQQSAEASPAPRVPPVDVASAVRAPPAGSPSPGVSPSSTEDASPQPPERSRSTTLAPQTHRHAPDAGDSSGEDIDVDTGDRLAPAAPAEKPPSPLPQPPGSVAGSVGSSTQGRLGLVRGSTLRGDVVAAVAGTPDVREANVALLAAARYGCSAVLLPAALETAVGLLEAPPSLDVEYVDDVVAAAVDLADRRGLTLLGVTAQQWEGQTQALNSFRHPVNSLYLFVSHEDDNAAAVADMSEVVLESVYVGTSRRELPANEVFFDRLRKEKAASQSA